MKSELKKTWYTSNHNLPSLWPYLLPEEYEYFEFPEEKTSDCSNCPQVSCHSYKLPQRCCTYIPRLPNYSIGMILKDEERRHLALDLIKKGMLIPEGLVIAPKLWKKSIELYDTDNFGKTDEIVCPFLNKENSYCNIHPYRNGVCSTFFCYPDYGDRADDFWGSIGSFIGQSEAALSQWCMEKKDYSNKEYFSLMKSICGDLSVLSKEDGSWSEYALSVLWRGMDFDKKVAFFEGCADLILDNIENLKEIVSSVKLDPMQPLELAQLKLLDDGIKDRLDDEIRVEGQAVSIRDLEYSLNASSRNMNYIPFAGAKIRSTAKFEIVENPKSSTSELFFKDYPFKLMVKSKGIWFIDEKEKKAVESFKDIKLVDSDLLDFLEAEGYEGRPFIRKWVGRDVLEYVES